MLLLPNGWVLERWGSAKELGDLSCVRSDGVECEL